jgi:hypothetical protein
MPVPKTAIHENDLAEAWKHDVGTAGKALAVEAKTISNAVDQASHGQFGARIDAPDLAHDPTALLGAELISHARSLYSR